VLGNKIKTNIHECWNLLEEDNKLNLWLTEIYKNIFAYSEIDFLRGIPISFAFVKCLKSLNTGKQIELQLLVVHNDFQNLDETNKSRLSRAEYDGIPVLIKNSKNEFFIYSQREINERWSFTLIPSDDNNFLALPFEEDSVKVIQYDDKLFTKSILRLLKKYHYPFRQFICIEARDINDLLMHGNKNDFTNFFDEYSILVTPYFFADFLRLTPPFRLIEVTSILEEINPNVYANSKDFIVSSVNPEDRKNYNIKSRSPSTLQDESLQDFQEYMQYFREIQLTQSYLTLNMNQLRQSAIESTKNSIRSKLFNLKSILIQLIKLIKTNAELRKNLMNQYKDKVHALQTLMKTLYHPTKLKYSGNDSMLRKILTTPEIVYAITSKNENVLLAIYAFEIEAQIQKMPLNDTFIREIESQHTGQKMICTLGTIFLNALSLDPAIVASIPLNEENSKHSYCILSDYIQQKIFSDILLTRIQTSLINLCNSHLLNIKLDDYKLPILDLATDWKTKKYQTLLRNMYNTLSDEKFCSNPSQIVREVRLGLKCLIDFLNLPEKLSPSEILSNTFSLDVSKEDFIEKFISSVAIIDSKISHLVFDTLHFAVALTNSTVPKFKLKDTTISFKSFIELVFETISQKELNEYNAIVSEQLAYRVIMLQTWCAKNNKSLNQDKKSSHPPHRIQI